MTTIEKLLVRKQQLIDRLLENPGPEEQEQIEGHLQKIDTALHLLDNVPASTSIDNK